MEERFVREDGKSVTSEWWQLTRWPLVRENDDDG